MFEIVNEFDGKIATKENKIQFIREPTDSLPSGNVKYLDKIDILLMIEADVTKNKRTIQKIVG